MTTLRQRGLDALRGRGMALRTQMADAAAVAGLARPYVRPADAFPT